MGHSFLVLGTGCLKNDAVPAGRMSESDGLPALGVPAGVNCSDTLSVKERWKDLSPTQVRLEY